MKRFAGLAFCGLLLSHTASSAGAEPLSFNIALVSDYVFRGISRSDNDPALQGGGDYRAASGLYGGGWGSTVENSGDDIELRVYGGYSAEAKSGIKGDVGLIAYRFPGAGRSNFEEVYGGLGFGPFFARVFYDSDNNNVYAEANARFDIGSGVMLALHLGEFNADRGEDYLDYSVGLSKAFRNLEIGLTFSDTDLSPSTDRNDDILWAHMKATF